MGFRGFNTKERNSLWGFLHKSLRGGENAQTDEGKLIIDGGGAHAGVVCRRSVRVSAAWV